MLLLAREPVGRYHIPERAFDKDVPAWRKMPLCHNGGLDLRAWHFEEAEQFNVSLVCGTCIGVFALRAADNDWAASFQGLEGREGEEEWKHFQGMSPEAAAIDVLYWHSKGYDAEHIWAVEIRPQHWVVSPIAPGGDVQLSDGPQCPMSRCQREE